MGRVGALDEPFQFGGLQPGQDGGEVDPVAGGGGREGCQGQDPAVLGAAGEPVAGGVGDLVAGHADARLVQHDLRGGQGHHGRQRPPQVVATGAELGQIAHQAAERAGLEAGARSGQQPALADTAVRGLAQFRPDQVPQRRVPLRPSCDLAQARPSDLGRLGQPDGQLRGAGVGGAGTQHGLGEFPAEVEQDVGRGRAQVRVREDPLPVLGEAVQDLLRLAGAALGPVVDLEAEREVPAQAGGGVREDGGDRGQRQRAQGVDHGLRDRLLMPCPQESGQLAPGQPRQQANREIHATRLASGQRHQGGPHTVGRGDGVQVLEGQRPAAQRRLDMDPVRGRDQIPPDLGVGGAGQQVRQSLAERFALVADHELVARMDASLDRARQRGQHGGHRRRGQVLTLRQIAPQMQAEPIHYGLPTTRLGRSTECANGTATQGAPGLQSDATPGTGPW